MWYYFVVDMLGIKKNIIVLFVASELYSCNINIVFFIKHVILRKTSKYLLAWIKNNVLLQWAGTIIKIKLSVHVLV